MSNLKEKLTTNKHIVGFDRKSKISTRKTNEISKNARISYYTRKIK